MSNNNVRNKPLIYFKSNILTDVNLEFMKFTGFSKKEIIGKSIDEIKDLLKISAAINLNSAENDINCFIFTKRYQPREVKIIPYIVSENEVEFSIREKRHSRIEHVMPYVDSIFSDNKIGVAIYSATGVILKLNNKFMEFAKIIPDKLCDFIGRDWMTKFSHVKKEHKIIYSNILKSGKPYHLIEVKLNNSGKDTYWNIDFVPIIIEDKFKYLVQSVREVTDSVENRKLIEKQKQELEAIIENISDEIIIFNKNGEYTNLNKAARINSLYDYKKVKNVKEAYEHVEIFELDGCKIELNEFLLNKVLRGEKLINYRTVRKNNNITQYREVNGTPIYDNEGHFVAGILAMRDIKDSIKYEESLYVQAQYESMKRMIDNFELGIARLSYDDFKFIDINSKGYEQFKMIKPEVCAQDLLINKSILHIYKDCDAIDKIEEIKKYLEENNIFYQTKKYNYMGTEVFYKYIFQPIYGLNNEIVEIVVMVIDVSEEENAKLLLENTLKIQDEIYSNVSHELKTPLNVIFSASQVLDMFLNNDLYDKERFIHYNNSIKQNCYRLVKLINNIVDISKSNAGFLKLNISNVNIVEVIENIVNAVSDFVKIRKLRILFDTNTKEKIIACDPIMIERVMLNLISNAVKFSDSESNVFVSFEDKGETVEISVKDQGIGISKEDISHLFDRFYRVDRTLSRNTEGSGIGLPLVKCIVENHGGKISVKSKIGEGSIFKIQLPVMISENSEEIYNKFDNNKKENIHIEFSDIYSNE